MGPPLGGYCFAASRGTRGDKLKARASGERELFIFFDVGGQLGAARYASARPGLVHAPASARAIGSV